MTQVQRSAQRAHKDGARNQMKADSERRTQYDPDWAVCPDGGSNNKRDYQRRFPTCNGYKCLYSCDSAWNIDNGVDREMNFNYEITVRGGVSERELENAVLEMEERMLIKLAEDVGVDDCICDTVGRGYRNLRQKKKVADADKTNRNLGAMPNDQLFINLSNFRKDEIVENGKCGSSKVPEGETCHKMIGLMEFVYNAPEFRRRQLNEMQAENLLQHFIDEGMKSNDFLDAEDLDPIITGMTFVPDTPIIEADPGVGGPGPGSNWGNEGNGGQGDEGDGSQGNTGSDQDGYEGEAGGSGDHDDRDDGTIVIDVPLAGPNAATRGNGRVQYGFVGAIVAVSLLAIFAVGLYLRRRKKKNAEEVEVDDDASLSSPEPADAAKEDGSFPIAKTPSYDLGAVTDDTVGASASGEDMTKPAPSSDVAANPSLDKIDETGDAYENEP